MYITKVIALAQQYYPNEYKPAEMCQWCDELSAKLLIDGKHIYTERILPIASDGTVLLPEGVNFENIERVIHNGRELAKTDARNFGKHTIELSHRQAIVIDTESISDDAVTVIYLVPYRPIRLIKYQGAVVVDNTADIIKMDDCKFVSGDSLKLTIGGSTYKGIPLIKTDYDPENERGWILYCAGGSLSGVTDTSSQNAVITRHVTEQTVCDAPWDSMYVDYVLARVCQYQRDWNAYDRYYSAYTTRFEEYKRWIATRRPADRGTIKNWW